MSYNLGSILSSTICLRKDDINTLHYENLPMQYTEISYVVKIEKFQ